MYITAESHQSSGLIQHNHRRDDSELVIDPVMEEKGIHGGFSLSTYLSVCLC